MTFVNHLTNHVPWLIVSIALGLGGCANYAQLQEADTVPEGELQQGIGASFTGYEIDIGTAENEEAESFIVPAINGWARYGVTDRFEAHAHAWLPLGGSIGGKYQLVGGRDIEGPALSLGGDIGYLSVEVGDSKLAFVDFYVPVYLGYRFSPDVALYGTPKYVLRTAFTEEDTDVGHIAGATLGATLGSDTRFHVEGSLLYDAQSGAPIYNGALGVTF